MAAKYTKRPSRPSRPTRKVHVKQAPSQQEDTVSQLLPLFKWFAVSDASSKGSSNSAGSRPSRPASQKPRRSSSSSPSRSHLDIIIEHRRKAAGSPRPRQYTRPGRIMPQRYTFLKELGSGRRGGQNEGIELRQGSIDKQLYVRKYFHKKDIEKGVVHKEIRNLQACATHPHINNLVAYHLDNSNLSGHITLDYCELGDLSGLIDRFAHHNARIAEPFIWWALLNMAQGLMWCHFGKLVSEDPDRRDWEPIYHRDLKPANVFMTFAGSRHAYYPRLVLGDFGLSVSQTDIDQGRCHPTECSGWTEGWKPPEWPMYNRRGDVWQVGGIAECLSRLIRQPTGDRRASREHSPALSRVIFATMRTSASERVRADALVRIADRVVRRIEPERLPRWAFRTTA